ncbi:hypothetical protein K458DRAFT_286597 [Lentithecium fluviatile CBS 122367]|uniref:G-protein coupled receptors family 2 profile 2 domain-containing protein n=1 Tax=Lentithecium fluviatile CBS 122367 TaxID=1168545 RepID=A0A6G1JN91_9PLEO|nr:hypothetical protein K458DRAFT_286597 [Lentithecium fluviatile CBS 122367]
MALQVSERTMSVLSIVGSVFIITTFLRWHYFRKPINRLVFYASFGNIMANVATLIATSALPSGSNTFSSLCEFQGILIQWFMMADSGWVFCMALNVMLVFFRGFDSRQLRRLEKFYLLACYGIPGIISIVYIILDHAGPKRIIGPATIWCWVSSDVEWMRIAFFYAPVWILITCTLIIYVVTGRQIFKKRSELRSFSRKAAVDMDEEMIANPFTAADIRKIKVQTEMEVTHSPLEQDSEAAFPPSGNESRSSFSSTNHLSNAAEAPATNVPTTRRFSRVNWEANPAQDYPGPMPQREDGARTGYRATAFSTNKTKGMVTVTPRSVSISHPNPLRRRHAAMEGNAAAWGYFKVAFLMFAALFIVWVPSTVNRLQQFIDKGHPIFGLNLASALVLPLQGFWNAMIYTSTTWPECKRAFAETLDALSRIRSSSRRISYSKDSNHTLSTNDNQEFAAIPLDKVATASESQQYLQSRESSVDTMRPEKGLPRPVHTS